jgi:hypothetical protein
VVYFALRRPDIAGPFTQYLREIDLERSAADGRPLAGVDRSSKS